MPIALPAGPLVTGSRSIGTVVLDDMTNSFISSMVCGYPRDVQLDQIHNRYGRTTRIKEDAKPLSIDVRGYWRDGGGRFWRDFEAALLSQSRVPFTLGDGTRYECCDVVSIVKQPIASRNAFGAVPDQAFSYVMTVASYEAFAREVTPTLQNLGSLLGATPVVMSADFETDVLGWTAGGNTAITRASANLLDSYGSDMTTNGGAIAWYSDTAGASRVTTDSLHNPDCMGITSVGGGTVDITTAAANVQGSPAWGIAITGGQTYTGVVHFKGVSVGRPCKVSFAWWDSSGHLIYDLGNLTNVYFDNTTTWTLASYTETAPNNAAYVTLMAFVGSTNPGEVHLIDCAGIFVGNGFGWTLAPFNGAPQWTAATGSAAMTLIALTANSASGTSAYTSPYGYGSSYPVTAGQQYTALASFRAALAARTCAVTITWQNAVGTTISTSTGTPITDNVNAWTQASVTATAPAGTAFAAVTVAVTSTTLMHSEMHYVDSVSLARGASTTWVNTALGVSTQLTVPCVGTAFSEPTWQFALAVPAGTTVSRVMLQNLTSGDTCVVTFATPLGGSGGGAGTGVYNLLMDASGGSSPPGAGADTTPGNNKYQLLAINSVGWGCTLDTDGGADIDFTGRPPTLVPSTAPTIPPTAQPNSIVATITSTGPLLSATLSVLSPARWFR